MTVLALGAEFRIYIWKMFSISQLIKVCFCKKRNFLIKDFFSICNQMRSEKNLFLCYKVFLDNLIIENNIFVMIDYIVKPLRLSSKFQI